MTELLLNLHSLCMKTFLAQRWFLGSSLTTKQGLHMFCSHYLITLPRHRVCLFTFRIAKVTVRVMDYLTAFSHLQQLIWFPIHVFSNNFPLVNFSTFAKAALSVSHGRHLKIYYAQKRYAVQNKGITLSHHWTKMGANTNSQESGTICWCQTCTKHDFNTNYWGSELHSQW